MICAGVTAEVLVAAEWAARWLYPSYFLAEAPVTRDADPWKCMGTPRL